MVSSKNILKIITVASSATLMAGFVAFKAGAFSNYFKDSNSFPPDSLKKDSLKVEENPDYIHSSKMLIIDWNETLNTDRADTATANSDLIIPSSKNDNIFDINDIQMMGGSKSMMIFEPNDSVLRPTLVGDSSENNLRSTKDKPVKRIKQK